VYLTELPAPFAETLVGLIGEEAAMLASRARQSDPATLIQVGAADVEEWEHHIEETIESDPNIPQTERETLIIARRGQGLFKQRVMQIETRCRVTNVMNPIHLRASHCKPWRDSTNEERVNGENGLLMTPNVDHLFDRGFISFEDAGNLIISPVAHKPSLERMGVPTGDSLNVGAFTDGQKRFLNYHRNSVLLRAVH
jgi:hypothetical protein